jgi:hypothetical protein
VDDFGLFFFAVLRFVSFKILERPLESPDFLRRCRECLLALLFESSDDERWICIRLAVCEVGEPLAWFVKV